MAGKATPGPRFKLEDKAIRGRLLDALRVGATHELACAHAGIAPPVFYRYMRRGREGDPRWLSLVEEVSAAEASGAISMMAVVQRAARDGTWQAAAWMLERRHGYTVRHGERVDVDNWSGGETTTAEPGTAEWLAEQVELAAALPPEVIAEAARRQRGA